MRGVLPGLIKEQGLPSLKSSAPAICLIPDHSCTGGAKFERILNTGWNLMCGRIGAEGGGEAISSNMSLIKIFELVRAAFDTRAESNCT